MRGAWRRHAPILGAVAAGGVVGAEARYLISLLGDGRPAFPWPTLVENITGCFLIGVLMAVLLELTDPHRLLRPFLGVGVLGGYTTFSAYAVDVRVLLLDERVVPALLYVVITPVAALVAVWLAMRVTRATLGRLRRGESW
ncbi:fluoride efflux transporter CrcB [Phytoactinopolyspora limicola]|uniref:fluoride efflux transporter CrcB n=1 Tax=Phytoactinopolyspora limicola TaxID=2715536 RepID=UPI00140A04E5|nr:fluoride efflux transporter CrcB [Phytoactinopolyspora limicola]